MQKGPQDWMTFWIFSSENFRRFSRLPLTLWQRNQISFVASLNAVISTLELFNGESWVVLAYLIVQIYLPCLCKGSSEILGMWKRKGTRCSHGKLIS